MASKLPQRDLLIRIGGIAAEKGRQAWLVGGPVRDWLLGLSGGDVDLTFDGSVQPIGKAIARELRGEFTWHSRFLTGRIDYDGKRIDVARTRTESYSRSAALPRVRPAAIEQDLARRDFSINAIALEIRKNGALIDPHNGQGDLRHRFVRILHSGSFIDDPTRIYRALRFATRLRFLLDRETRWLLRQAVAKDLHHRLSGQRIAAELRKTLAEQRAAQTLSAFIREGLGTPWGVREMTIPSVLRSVNGRLRALQPGAGLVDAARLACAFAHLPIAQRRTLANNLKLRRAESRALIEAPRRAVQLLARLNRLSVARDPATIDSICSDYREDEVLVAAVLADATSYRRLARWYRQTRNLALRISGADLIRAGISPGPGIAKGLRAARTAFLDGKATTRQAQLRRALTAARRT